MLNAKIFFYAEHEHPDGSQQSIGFPMIPAPLRVIRHVTPGRIVRTQLPAADLYDLFSDPDSSIDYLKGNSLNPTIRNHQLLFSVGVVIDEWSASSQEAVVVVMQCRRMIFLGKKTFRKTFLRTGATKGHVRGMERWVSPHPDTMHRS